MNKIIFALLFSVLFCFENKLPLNKTQSTNSNSSINSMIGIMVQFALEQVDDPNTTGDGHFLLEQVSEAYNRCNGFIVDRPPHNKAYFESQMLSVSNYFSNVSNGQQIFNEIHILDAVYELPNSMASYSQSDSNLTNAFKDALYLAKDDLLEFDNILENSIIIVFHAGIGQDFAVPLLDPTPYDLSSAYVDSNMLDGWDSLSELGFNVEHGIILPETQNHIFYDVIEDLFWSETDFCDYQIGLTGIFSLLMGYALGLPPLYNTDTGDAGVGVFGLMDYGSNNGRGVIPSHPTPWTKIYMGWDEPIVISKDNNLDSLEFSIDDSQIYRINASENEYFLIENRNNWVHYKADMDSLRIKNKIDDTRLGHWFDTFIDETTSEEVVIDPITNVIVEIDNYNYGLPGSGLLVWHITNSNNLDFIGLNNDSNNRVVHLEEADGAVDIGFPTTAMFADPTKGWRWDMWYNNNPAYNQLNPYIEDIAFNDISYPNTRTNDGSESFISIFNISDINYNMNFNVLLNDGLDYTLLNTDSINIIGNGNKNNIGYIYYTSNNYLYNARINNNALVIDSILIENDFNKIFLSNELCDTLVTPLTPYSEFLTYIDDDCNVIYSELDDIYAKGYIDNLLETSEFDKSINSYQGFALADLDLDGYDEYIKNSFGNIRCNNKNGTLSDGFPLEGNFIGTPLVANILGDSHPEIICRENNNIVIISHIGERLKTISSFDTSQQLSLIPNWAESAIGLIDGNRVFSFSQDLDNSYWLNKYSRPSNYPLVTGPNYRMPGDDFYDKKGLDKNRAYNYPNPIKNSNTTFRYYIGIANRVDITIFNASGFKVDKLKNAEITKNEFNETYWDASAFPSGLYFAEIKPDIGKSALVRVMLLQ